MKSLATAAALALVVSASLSLLPLRGEDAKPQDAPAASLWMKKKLEWSQNILVGLTEKDFDKIGTNAQKMNLLGHFESWARSDRPDYKLQVNYFDFANRELIRQAKEKNLAGATLAYNQVVVSCVQCHNIVRDAK